MSRPAFIVDGDQEQRIVQRICPGSPVKRLQCNGKDVVLDAAAERIASLIRLLGGKCYPVIVVFDREGRKESAAEICAGLRELLQDKGVSEQLVIGVPDRMIENWTLADWDSVCQKCRIGARASGGKCFEGTYGKSQVRKLLPSGRKYEETTDGVDWFIAADRAAMVLRSASYHAFDSQLTGLSCRWLQCPTPSADDIRSSTSRDATP
jgi:hypothetical protein